MNRHVAGAFLDPIRYCAISTVLLVATVEPLAITTIALGVAGRFGGAALTLVMVGAMATAGPTIPNGIVLVACLLITTQGTGPYSLWDPPVRALPRIPHQIQDRTPF